MATTTRAVARRRLSEVLNDYQAMTTSGAGDAGGTTLVDTSLADLSADDAFCEGWYILITSGTNDGESRPITGYVASTNTITVASAFTGQVANAVTYELHRHDPAKLNTAISRASASVFAKLYLALSDESLVVDNLLLNPSLDTFSTTFTNWTNIGTPTLAAETTRKVHGTGSASIAATGATEGIEQNLLTAVNINEVVGKTLHVRAWLFCATSSSARIRVTFDGSTYTDGSWHSGDVEWEGPGVHRIDVTVPADATEMTVSCEVESGVTAYFDRMAAWIDPIERYTIPTAMLRGPFYVLYQVDENKPEGLYLPIPPGVSVPAGRVLRLTGMGLLSQPSTDAGTIEIGEPQIDLFTAHAARWYYRSLLQTPGTQESASLERRIQEWGEEIARLENTPGMTMYRMSAEQPMGAWKVGEDANGRYLYLRRS